MKTQTVILFFIISILSSCDTKDGGNYPYKTWLMEIENSSNHLIRLKFYSYFFPIQNIDTTLSINQRYILSKGDQDPFGSGPDLITSTAFDSSVVIFDDGKKLIYTHNKTLSIMNDSANNILLKENYLLKSTAVNKDIFNYTIDETDYQRAEK
jgi:hypothetical protein